MNNLQQSARNFNTDWQFGVFKRGKDNGHDTWKILNVQIVSFFIFSKVCCRQFQYVPTTYVFSINEFFTISFF